MAKFIRIAGNSKNRKRAVSLLLAVTVLVSSVIFFGDRNMDGVAAEEYSRAYIEYIIDRMVEGLQKEFTILEIVPYEGQGMIRYYLSDPEIEEALEADQAKLEYLYNNYRGGRIDYGGERHCDFNWTNGCSNASSNFGSGDGGRNDGAACFLT